VVKFHIHGSRHDVAGVFKIEISQTRGKRVAELCCG